MADAQKPLEVQETVPATTEAPVEAKAVDPAVAEAKPAEAEPAADSTPAAAEAKEPTPVEEGHLEHKGAGANFPKNFMYSKQFFWFGSDAFDPKNLSAYLKGEKHPQTGHQTVSWASHTGNGLLFYGDKSNPHGVVNLADASEPVSDGANKFHFTSKGHKHTFKTSSAAERDNWVNQIKTKIVEAKELAKTVPETEAYKKTMETFKPVLPAKKEETPAEAPKEEAEAPKEEPAKEEAKAEEPAKEEPAKEDTKQRSASSKRASILGYFGKKDKKEEEKTAAPEAATTDAPTEPAAPAAEETPAPAEPVLEVPAPAPVEAAPAEDKAVESPKEKSPTSKRNSFFGLLKKDKKSADSEAAPAAPAKDAEAPAPVSAEPAPVIPPVEAVTPLSAEVASPATVPVETKDVTAPATNGETKKEMKNEKRKSSMPSLGFSKLRDTIRNRKPGSDKAAAKTEDKPADAEVSTAAAEPEAPKPAEEEPIKAAPVASSAPVVTAAA